MHNPTPVCSRALWTNVHCTVECIMTKTFLTCRTSLHFIYQIVDWGKPVCNRTVFVDLRKGWKKSSWKSWRNYKIIEWGLTPNVNRQKEPQLFWKCTDKSKKIFLFGSSNFCVKWLTFFVSFKAFYLSDIMGILSCS